MWLRSRGAVPLRRTGRRASPPHRCSGMRSAAMSPPGEKRRPSDGGSSSVRSRSRAANSRRSVPSVPAARITRGERARWRRRVAWSTQWTMYRSPSRSIASTSESSRTSAPWRSRWGCMCAPASACRDARSRAGTCSRVRSRRRARASRCAQSTASSGRSSRRESAGGRGTLELRRARRGAGQRRGLQDGPHAVVVAAHLLGGDLLREVIPEALVGLRLDIGVDRASPRRCRWRRPSGGARRGEPRAARLGRARASGCAFPVTSGRCARPAACRAARGGRGDPAARRPTTARARAPAPGARARPGERPRRRLRSRFRRRSRPPWRPHPSRCRCRGSSRSRPPLRGGGRRSRGPRATGRDALR